MVGRGEEPSVPLIEVVDLTVVATARSGGKALNGAQAVNGAEGAQRVNGAPRVNGAEGSQRVNGAKGVTPQSVTILDGVGFRVIENSTLGIIGESGSGKTMTSRSVAGLLPRGVRVAGGHIRIRGTDVTDWSQQTSIVRGRDVGFIFQNPSSMLTPVLPIGRQLMEGLIIHHRYSRRDAKERAEEGLELVGLGEKSREIMASYPHQLSGGMLQRVMIAMAILPGPRVLIADEPTASLDTVTQLTVLELLARLREELRLGILFVSHNLGAVSNLCDETAVMQNGRIVEQGPTRALFANPNHPYTKRLMESTVVHARSVGNDVAEEHAEWEAGTK